jgi:stage V sporulation protein S
MSCKLRNKIKDVTKIKEKEYMMTKNFDETQKDPTLIMVRGSFPTKDEMRRYTKQISREIAEIVRENGMVRLRGVGAAAVNTSVKSLGVYNDFYGEENVCPLAMRGSFQTVVFDDGEVKKEKTAILIEARPMKVKEGHELLPKPEDSDSDMALLKIKGYISNKEESKHYVKKLAGAIVQVVEKHGCSRLRCVGAGAVNNAVKSIIVASGISALHGDNLAFDVMFETIEFGGENKTALTLEVKPMVAAT